MSNTPEAAWPLRGDPMTADPQAVLPAAAPSPAPSPFCGLMGCEQAEKLADRIESGGAVTPPAPPPPPTPPPAWYDHPWLWLFAVAVLLVVAAVIAVRRSDRLRELLREATGSARAHARPAASSAATSVRLQAQPAQVAKWAGPLGRLAARGARGASRFVAAGHGARGKTLRAAVMVFGGLFVLGAPLGAGGLLLGALSAVTGLPGWLLLLALVGVAVVFVVASRDGGEEAATWWSEKRLVAALVAAGVLPSVKEGEPRHVLRRRGQPRTDERGTTVTVELPGQPWRLVRDRADRLAAALRIDADRLVVEHPEGTPAGVVRLWVGTGKALPAAAPPVADAEVTTWTEPLRLGADARGRAVTLATVGVHTALAGASGSGKTTAARLLVAHALLDPTTRVYVIDGKGDSADWSEAAPSCAGFVGTITDDTPEQVAAIFAEVLALVRERAAASAGRGRAPWPGVLLVVEEWAAVRSHAATVLDRKGVEQLDRAMATLLATARSSGVHVAVLAQRLTADNMATSQRANVAQRVVMRCLSPEDYAAALGCSPTGATPSRKGLALLVNEDEHQPLVTVDHLTDEAWQAVCERAATARSGAPAYAAEPTGSPWARPVAGVSLTKGEPEAALTAPEPAALDPLLDAVLGILRDADPRGLPASALLDRLPVWLAPADPAALGRALRGHAQLARGHVGKSQVWRLAHPSATPPVSPGKPPEPTVRSLGDPSADPRRSPGPRGTGGSGQAEPPRPGTSVDEPSEPSVAAL